MIILRAAADRGRANFGWLRSAHTFSFGEYFDARFNGFSALRVINDDRVDAKAGFPTHGHRNMEIISYVLEGSIAHRDSTGTEEVLPAGEFQLMSAGRGIRHSEFNPSDAAGLHFLQIWIQPNATETEPGYQQRPFARSKAIQAVITPDGRDGTLLIRQDAVLNHVRLDGEEVQHPLNAERCYYLHIIRGPLTLECGTESLTVNEGDGVAVQHETLMALRGGAAAEALLFDLPGAQTPT